MEFMKMVASGNDFIVVDARTPVEPGNLADLARKLCLRRLSVGSDGLLVLAPSRRAEFRMRIFNPDGSEAEMCGNGLRCFLLYLVKRGLVPEERFISVETMAGVKGGEVRGSQVTATLGKPEDLVLSVSLRVGRETIKAGSVNTGVPHLVQEVPDLDLVPVVEQGRLLRNHPSFAPAGTNVNFVQVREGILCVRTYERGVEAETLSCGTGTAASALLMNRWGKVSFPVRAETASGERLTVEERGRELLLGGETRLAYEGKTAS